MKKFLFFLMGIALLGVSCQQDKNIYNATNGDMVEVNIGVGVPELATRSGETDMNSGLGAIDNFSADEWDLYDVRYMLEIYDVTDGYANLETPIKKREIKTYDEYQETMFTVRLVPNRDYRFVLWADFVNEGSEDDLYYDTTDLNKVTRLGNTVAMDECQDAYFIQKDLKVGTNGIEESLVLKRPFGKIRVITTDYDEVNIGSEPAKVVVKFYNHKLLTTLNAVTGIAEGETVNEYTYDVTKETSPYTKGYDELEQNMTLFADYILAADETVGAQEVNFTIEVTGKDGRVINSHDFNTQIPLERNHLTTIAGNLLTLQNDIVIRIDDNFDGEYVIDNLWDGEFEPLPAANAEGWIEIETPGQMATLLNSDPDGMKVRLMEDINFDGAELTLYRNGAKGSNTPFEFDGNNRMITNFTVSEGVSAGLFADLVKAKVYNLTIKNAVVAPGAATRAAGDFYAGALVGRTYGTCEFNNIKVVECEIEGVNKVGGLIGNVAEDTAIITNCVVEASKVSTTSVDDGGCVGGLVGYVTGNATIENNTVRNTEINAINSANEAKRANAEVVGTFHGNGKTLTFTNNTCEGNTFNQQDTTYVAPEKFYPWLGGIRFETKANVIVDGVSIVALPLATPDVKTAVAGNVITLTWEAVENAGSYTVSGVADMPAVVEDTTYVFTGEFETEYTFTVVAVPADEATHAVSEAAIVTATTEVKPTLATPAVKAEVAGNVVTLTWAAVENAATYTVSGVADMPAVVEDTTYVFTGEHETEYTFTVVAVPADETTHNVSEAATVTITTEAEPIVEPVETKVYLYPGDAWPSDGAWFAAYFFGNGDTWRTMELVDGSSDIYEVVVPEGYTSVIFCRMNPASKECNWDNKWNQTNDLTIPTDGKNYFIITNPWDPTTGYWDVGVAVDATLSFADKAYRTVFTTSQQVWEQNGVILTNDKAKSTNNVADYAKPARFYANSSITLTAPGNIKTIVFDCSSTSYATALKNSIGSTATASSDKVTVSLDGTTDLFSIASLSAQVRMDTITVTYVK